VVRHAGRCADHGRASRAQADEHPAFTLKNPNRARSLIFNFTTATVAIPRADGSGYAFWAEQVIALDAINPQVAARLARAMDRWRRYVPALQAKMRGRWNRSPARQAVERRDGSRQQGAGQLIFRLTRGHNHKHSMKRISLTQYLVEEQRLHNNIPAELRLLIEVVARACKTISHAVSKGALGEVLGTADTKTCRAKCRRSWTSSPTRSCSKPMNGAATWRPWPRKKWNDPPIPNRYPKGEYLLLFDPLDGSSNIDVNVSIGTIFSVLKAPEGMGEPTEQDFMQPAPSRWPPATPSTARRPCWC
jgi:hypothetical protein